MLVDVGEWPLVVVNWPPGVATDDDVDQILAELTSLYGRQHAVMHASIRSGGLTAAARRRVTAHSSQHDEEVRRWVVASAAVAPSPWLRALITAVQWTAPPPMQFKLFATTEEAREWLLQVLRRAGLWRPGG